MGAGIGTGKLTVTGAVTVAATATAKNIVYAYLNAVHSAHMTVEGAHLPPTSFLPVLRHVRRVVWTNAKQQRQRL
jgi:hypothetical protein